MIAGLAKIVTDFFLKNNVIDREDTDVYQYGNEIIISSLFDLLIVLVVGLIYNALINSLLFFVPFFLLRSFSGGYHANTYLKCKIVFLINISLSLFLSTYASSVYEIYSLVLLLLFSIFVIWGFAPIENENKPLSEEEIIINSKRSKIIGIILFVSIIITYYYNKNISLSLLLSFFSVAVGMIIEYFRKGASRKRINTRVAKKNTSV